MNSKPKYAYVVQARDRYLAYTYIDHAKVYLSRGYNLSKIIRALEDRDYLIVNLV